MRVSYEIPPGMFSDDTTFAMPGAWETGSNVRFRLGRPEVIGGWNDILSGDTVDGVCRNAYAWSTASGVDFIAFGTHSHLEVLAGGDVVDITPSGLVEGAVSSSSGSPGWGTGAWNEGTWGEPASVWYARTWALSSYGDWLIANPRGGTIYYWDGDVESDAEAVDNAPSSVTACLVTPERQLLAFGCNEEVSDNFNHLCIRGSDIEDITNWTTGITNNAFEHILEGGGRIVAARMVGPYVAVWTTQGLHLGQFLGNPGQTYRFDLIAGNCGLIGPNALAIFDQTAVWVGTDYQFRTWTLGGVPQIMTCPIHRDFRDNLVTEQADKIVGTAISSFGEAWFFYPDRRDGDEASRYVAFSFRESGDRPVWFKGELARTQAMDAGITPYPVMTEFDGHAYYHEYGKTANEDDLDWSLTSSDTYIDEGGREMLVRRLIPDFEQQAGDVVLTIRTKRYPQSDAVTKGPYTAEPGTEKIDFRTSGRLISTTWEGAGYTRFGKPLFDVVGMGRR